MSFMQSWLQAVILVVSGVLAITVAVSYAQSAIIKIDNQTLVQKLKGSAPQDKLVIKDNNVEFRLVRCQRKAQRVTCSFLVTSAYTRNIGLYLMSGYLNQFARSVDLSGNQYLSTLVEIENSNYSGHASATLTQGVPVKARISFEIPKEVTKLALLELKYNYQLLDETRALVFRNIQIVEF